MVRLERLRRAARRVTAASVPVLNRRSTRYAGIVGLVSALSVVARYRVPVVADNSAIDSGLFLHLANYLNHGKWLGPFNYLTLAKGPSYPALIAACARLHIPLKVAEQLTYLAAAACIGLSFWLVTRRTGRAVAVYVVLAANPMNFDSANALVLRDGWATSLSLLFVAATFLTVHAAVAGVRWWVVIPGAVLAGGSGAAFWLCREESPWLVPSIATVVAGVPMLALCRWWFGRDRTWPGRKQALLRAGRFTLAMAVLGAVFAAPIAFVEHENKVHYGVALTNDTSSGQFAAAYASWLRVQAGQRSDRHPITYAQRAAVYRVSPAARAIEPVLESPRSFWISASCGQAAAARCDLPGAFAPWAIRDAAWRVGKLHNETSEQAYFGQLRREIDQACADRRLQCAPAASPTLVRLDLVSVGQLWDSATRLLREGISSSAYTDPQATLTTDPVTLSPADRATAHALVPRVPATQQAAAAQLAHFHAHDLPYRLLGAVYRVALPWLLVLAAAVAVVRLVRVRRWPGPLLILDLALLAGVGARAVVLALVDVVEFHTDSPRYGLPIPEFLLTASVLVVAAGVHHRQAQREADEHQLHAGDDQDHADDRDSHGGNRVEVTEPLRTPVHDGRDERGHPAQRRPESDQQATLEGDPFQGALHARARR